MTGGTKKLQIAQCLKCESGSSRFQPGEGPSRGLLRDCTTLPINRFAALVETLSPCPGAPGPAAGRLHHRARPVPGARSPRQLPLALVSSQVLPSSSQAQTPQNCICIFQNVANKYSIYIIYSIFILSRYLSIYFAISQNDWMINDYWRTGDGMEFAGHHLKVS